jgi:hypothetical protein
MLLDPLHAWIPVCESLTHFGALLVQPMCISWHYKKAIVHQKRHTIARRFSEDSLNILLRFSSNLAQIFLQIDAFSLFMIPTKPTVTSKGIG